MFDRALAPLGITRSQWWVLAFISRKDGMPQTQLANELDVGKVAVGALIDRLESSGFVMRQADPIDRRVKRVYVTKQARGFLEKLRKETDKFNARIVNGIELQKMEAASDALFAMKHNLLAMSDSTQNGAIEDKEEDGRRFRGVRGLRCEQERPSIPLVINAVDEDFAPVFGTPHHMIVAIIDNICVALNYCAHANMIAENTR